MPTLMLGLESVARYLDSAFEQSASTSGYMFLLYRYRHISHIISVRLDTMICSSLQRCIRYPTWRVEEREGRLGSPSGDASDANVCSLVGKEFLLTTPLVTARLEVVKVVLVLARWAFVKRFMSSLSPYYRTDDCDDVQSPVTYSRELWSTRICHACPQYLCENRRCE